MERIGLTAQIGTLAAAAANSAIPGEAIHAARRAFVDTLGVILAGRGEPVVGRLAPLLPEGAEAFALAGNRGLAASDAALLDGLAGHVLDYDDVAQAGHPSVVLVPAILAEAQRLGLGGGDALRAYGGGYEAWAEIARREPDAYHLGSWHPTSMIGIVAATAALAALNRLDARAASHAAALATSMASGVIASFGTHAKPLQAGRAAANAVTAVRWAAAGIEGGADALEGAHGLLRGISPQGRVETAGPIGAPWRLLEQGLSVKRYPVCYAAHRAIDGVIALAERENLRAGDVRAVTVQLGQAPAETLRYHHPRTGLEARFSLHHNVAAALTDRAVGFAQLTDDFVRRPDVAALYGLTRMEVGGEDCPDQPGMARFDRVVIALADGRELDSGPIRYAKGSAETPLSDDELADKFLDCARHGGHPDPEALLGRLWRLDELSALTELFQ